MIAISNPGDGLAVSIFFQSSIYKAPVKVGVTAGMHRTFAFLLETGNERSLINCSFNPPELHAKLKPVQSPLLKTTT